MLIHLQEQLVLMKYASKNRCWSWIHSILADTSQAMLHFIYCQQCGLPKFNTMLCKKNFIWVLDSFTTPFSSTSTAQDWQPNVLKIHLKYPDQTSSWTYFQFSAKYHAIPLPEKSKMLIPNNRQQPEAKLNICTCVKSGPDVDTESLLFFSKAYTRCNRSQLDPHVKFQSLCLTRNENCNYFPEQRNL